jgi:CRISPR-associated protein Csd1
MSWIQRLVETYDNCKSMVGVETSDDKTPLLPICHTTQRTHVEITIDGSGNFRRAEASLKIIFIPCTESSGGRTSGPVPHPLCDKLQYVAMDYASRGGEKTHSVDMYISQLEKWCNSNFSHPKAKAILKYVKKGRVIEDLIASRVLIAGPDGKLLKQWSGDKKDTPTVFSLLTNQERQADILVRWVVEGEEVEATTWMDKSLWQSWIEHYLDLKKENVAFCYISGTELVVAEQHPRRIRNEADGAKLISANDDSGFTYRGRFNSYQQAAGVGLEASHKAHYALKWLLERQGYRKGDLAIVAWATSGVPVPQPTDDLFSLMHGDAPIEEHAAAQELAIQLKKRIAGYGKQLGSTDKVVVMALDSATTGRLAVTYYRDLTASDFLQRIDAWHESCTWLHRYRRVEVQDKQSRQTSRKVVPFIGAPAPNDIAEAAYGSTLDKKLRSATIERILPCIIDGQPLPRDLVESTFRRACNRDGIKNPDDKRFYGDEEFTWKKVLSIACALFRKHNSKENYPMALDPTRNSRDYLYGRLLALADSLEEWALNEANENRQTNAARLMQRFAERPYSTWRTIELALTPYKARLGGKSRKRQQMFDEVIATFAPDDFISDKRLSGEFLLGYHSQREFLRASRNQEDHSEEDSDN